MNGLPGKSEGVILFFHSELCYVAEWFILRTSDQKPQDNSSLANCQLSFGADDFVLAGQTIGIRNLSGKTFLDGKSELSPVGI
jgi:hypothetical protein